MTEVTFRSRGVPSRLEWSIWPLQRDYPPPGTSLDRFEGGQFLRGGISGGGQMAAYAESFSKPGNIRKGREVSHVSSFLFSHRRYVPTNTNYFSKHQRRHFTSHESGPHFITSRGQEKNSKIICDETRGNLMKAPSSHLVTVVSNVRKNAYIYIYICLSVCIYMALETRARVPDNASEGELSTGE